VETTRQIERHIEKTRDELGANVEELEQKVKQMGDWRHQFGQHPLTLLGVAFGGGVFLASMLGTTRRVRAGAPSYNASGLSHKAVDTWDHIKDALIGVAATRVTDFVGELVPGFKEEFSGRSKRDVRPEGTEFLA